MYMMESMKKISSQVKESSCLSMVISMLDSFKRILFMEMGNISLTKINPSQEHGIMEN